MARSSQEWVDYFRWNGSVAMRVPWYLGADLTDAEREAISPSARVFQLGGYAQDRRFMRCAQEWANRSGDSAYPEAIRLLIAEERRHLGVLGRFMEINGIAKIERGCTNGVFRRMRSAFGGLEVSIAVLVTAEILAKVYYPALRNATQSTVLRSICEEVLREEIAHLEFQTEQLACIRVGRSSLALWATTLLHRILFYPTAVVVGLAHRIVLRRAGLTAGAYWAQCRKNFLEALSAMEPHSHLRSRPSSLDKPRVLAGSRQ
jgi:hypothetical protein